MEKNGLLFESIFKRKLTDDNTVGYLEALAKEHPYFSVAQFYLLQVLEKNSNGYKTQAKKTATLFNNNHWLNFQLLEAGCNDQQSIVAETVTENFADKIYNSHTTSDTGMVEQPEIISNEPVSIPAEIIAEPITENAVEEIHIEEDKPAESEPIEEPAADTNNNFETVITKEEEKEITTGEESSVIKIVEENIPVIETVTEIEAPEAAIQNEPVVEEIKEVAGEKIIPVTIEIAAKVEELLFEPLHTSDYFASVGIKLSEEEKSSDKLGKQLKSFTDWLKTMKRVHTQQLAQTTTPAEVEAAGAESSIQKLAEKSNQENDVITEAMAEVLLQQGRKDKAIEILEN